MFSIPFFVRAPFPAETPSLTLRPLRQSKQCCCLAGAQVLAWYDLGFHVAAIFINLDLSKMLNIHVRGVNSPGGSSNSVGVGFLGRVN